jgi:hypothetical protein
MKRLLLIFILTFSFHTLIKADEIKDFQIEGMSIGDSLLNFMTKKEIKKNKRNYVSKTAKFYVTGFNNINNYDSLDVYLKRKDNNYIIKGIIGFVFLDVKKCKIKMKKVSIELDQMFKNSKKIDSGQTAHQYDKTGNSKEYQIAYLLNDTYNDDHIRINCTDWSKKITKEKNWGDSLNVGAYSKEILDWIERGYD